MKKDFSLTPPAQWERFPRTRYLGSKRKLLPVLASVFERLEFETALDAFSGTGAVAYLLKSLGAKVTACDVLESNIIAARALVANQGERLGDTWRSLVAGLPAPCGEPGFIERTFDEVFFEREENRFLDGFLPRAHGLEGAHRDLALYALFQACLAKRPYNLFHRANLSMRRANVRRTFGNKSTWERPFSGLIREVAAEADAAIFDSGRPCHAEVRDALQVDPCGYDLVYLDPPYVSAAGQGVDYGDYYHFLEGLAAPEQWPSRILEKYKHKPLEGRGQNPFSNPARIKDSFQVAIERFQGCRALVVSYRSDGIPSLAELVEWLAKTGKHVQIHDTGTYTYALSKNRDSREVILVAT